MLHLMIGFVNLLVNLDITLFEEHVLDLDVVRLLSVGDVAVG